MFKKEFKKHGCYYIVPAKQLHHPEKGYYCDVDLNFKIFKKKIELRNYKDITSSNDLDSTLKSEDLLNRKF